jgi:CRISPR-associated protein Csb2
LEKVWGRGGHDLQLVYLGCGNPDDIAERNTRAGGCPLFASSQVWVSSTPFVPTRLPKYNRNRKPRLDENGLHQGTPEHDLRRLLRLDGKPDPIEVAPLPHTLLGNHKTRWLEFIRGRRKDPEGQRLGYGFRITFPIPVKGPIALGYGSHFGLGLFVPEPE